MAHSPEGRGRGCIVQWTPGPCPRGTHVSLEVSTSAEGGLQCHHVDRSQALRTPEGHLSEHRRRPPRSEPHERRSQPARGIATIKDTSTSPVPAHLEPNGGAIVFTELAGASWISAIDREMATQLAEAVDERRIYRAAVAEHGPLLTEPIVTPKGDVVGERLVANPRRADGPTLRGPDRSTGKRSRNVADRSGAARTHHRQCDRHRRGRDARTQEAIVTASDSAAGDLLAVLVSLTPETLEVLAEGMSADPSEVVRAMGRAIDLLPEAPVMAELSLASAFGSARLTPTTDRLIDELGDDVPWGTVRAGLEVVRADWKDRGGR